MNTINKEKEKYFEMFYEKKFTEYDFLGTLLRLLSQEGVMKINEFELERKLFPYYRSQEYRELFQDVSCSREDFGEKLDLNNAFYREKYFGSSVWYTTCNSVELYLIVDAIEDLPYFEKSLSDDGKRKIRKLAYELGVQYAAEKSATMPLYIYKSNPNRNYFLPSGEYGRSHYSFEMLTDGEILGLEQIDTRNMEHIFYPSSYSINERVQLTNLKEICFEIKNASFALKKGLCNHKLCYSVLNTQMMDKNTLLKLVLLANDVGYESNNIPEESFVRKVTLK